MPRIYLSAPHLGDDERRLLLEAVDSNWIAPLGPHVDAFEAELAARLGVPHVAALSSGTAALHLALLLAGVRPGDEVLTSTLTFAGTVNPICYVGARPVLLDSDEASWNLDAALLADELDACVARGRLPAAVIAVDLYGQCADLEAIAATCARHGVPLIEDAAEALGATCAGRPAGSFGDLAVLSFNGNKIITTSGGGALVSANDEWIRRARFLATQARDPAPHYEHSVVGYNYRLSNLLAAVGRGQLRVLEQRVARRRAINALYREALCDVPGVAFQPEAPWGTSTFWLTCITLDPHRAKATPDDVRLALAAHDVESRPLWKPMHRQPVFADARHRLTGVADRLFAQGLCLPSGSGLSDEQVHEVAGHVRAALHAGPGR